MPTVQPCGRRLQKDPNRLRFQRLGLTNPNREILISPTRCHRLRNNDQSDQLGHCNCSGPAYRKE